MPADNKWFTRVVVAAAIIDALGSLDLSYPKVDKPDDERSSCAKRDCAHDLLRSHAERVGLDANESDRRPSPIHWTKRLVPEQASGFAEAPRPQEDIQ